MTARRRTRHENPTLDIFFSTTASLSPCHTTQISRPDRTEHDNDPDRSDCSYRSSTKILHMPGQCSLSYLVSPPSFLLNAHGGVYENGKPYPTVKKLDVANTYLNLKYSSNGARANPTNVAREAKVGWVFANKVIKEVEEHGHVLSLEEIQAERPEPLGVGSRSLSIEDEKVLEWIYYEKPYLSNKGYVSELFDETGTLVSPSLIQQWFERRWTFKGHFVEPKARVPLDKFRPENLDRMYEYGGLVSLIPDHRKFHFLDESKICGSDLCNRKVRRNPFNGSTPAAPVPSDFRDSYSMFACTTCWPDRQPVEAIFTEDNGDACLTMIFIRYLLQQGHFNRRDVVVMDRWTGHTGAEAQALEDFLWNVRGPDGQPMEILVLLLPARCPELNPIELVFQTIKKRMKSKPLSSGILGAAVETTMEIDRDLILKTMIHCGY